jgi:hypothetical protein
MNSLILNVNTVYKVILQGITTAQGRRIHRRNGYHFRVGTKVFAFVFSGKFSRNSLFVFAKDSLRKDETFANESERRENDVVLQQISFGGDENF